MKSYFKNFSTALCVLAACSLNPIFTNNISVSAENQTSILSSANTQNYIYSDDNGLLNINYNLFGKSFDEINQIFNSELDEPQDFPYWGFNFKNVDYTYNDIPVCFMFQYDKLVAIVYDRLTDFDENTYNRAVELFGEDTDNVWNLDNCSFSILMDNYENGDYYFRQIYLSYDAIDENCIYSDDNGLLNINYNLFGKSFDEINQIFNSELDEPQDFPYWGFNFKNVDYTYNDIPVCFMFQYDKLVAIVYDRLTDFDENTYNHAVELFGEDTDNVWNLDNCSFSISMEPYENDDYYFRQTYLSYDTIDENCIYSDDNGLLNINYNLFGKSFDEINQIFNSELDEPQDFPYWGFNFKNVDYTYNDIPISFMFQYDKLVAIVYDRLTDFDENTYNHAVELFGEDTDNVWNLDNCSFSISMEPYENGDYYFRQTYLSYDTVDTLTGDITKDGNVDILDVVLLKRYIVNLDELDELALTNADTTKDGSVDVKDLGQLIKYIIKVIDTFDL